MRKRFLNLLKQDITVAARNYFHGVILFVAALMIIFINFIAPEEIKLTPTELFFDHTKNKAVEKFLIQRGVDEDRFFHSKNELLAELHKNDHTIGIIIEGDLEHAEIMIIHQGMESNEILNLLDTTIEDALDKIKGVERKANYRVQYLRPRINPIPFNKNIIPMILMIEPVMLGFLLITVMVFQEKEEGSIQAYRISPGRTLEYILSKAAVNVLLSSVYAVLLVVFTIGFDINYPVLIILIILASFFITLLGLTVSVFFRNFQEFLFVGVFILTILGFPLISYLNPSFTPLFISWIPSYAILFGLREVLFPTGKESFVLSLNLLLVIESVLLLVISYWAVQKKLMKEGE